MTQYLYENGQTTCSLQIIVEDLNVSREAVLEACTVTEKLFMLLWMKKGCKEPLLRLGSTASGEIRLSLEGCYYMFLNLKADAELKEGFLVRHTLADKIFSAAP